jgi:hypothetical protein
MKTHKRKSLIWVVALIIAASSSLLTSRAAAEKSGLASDNWITLEADSVLAQNAALALRHLAAARDDLANNNIPSAQAEIGKIQDIMGRMKAHFRTIRSQELIAGARIRLGYENPKQVLAYLDLITPTLEEDISNPSTLAEAKQALARAEGFLENSDKDAADRELAVLTDVLLYKTRARPLALAEKHLVAAASDLDKKNPKDADLALAASQDELTLIAFNFYSPTTRAERSLRQAALEGQRHRWGAAEASLERASHAIERTLTDASISGRTELENLNGEIRSLIGKSTEKGEQWRRSVVGLWERAESLGKRAREYETAAFANFQSSDANAGNLIEAKLHVDYAESYEFTTEEPGKAASELGKAEVYLQKARPRLGGKEEAALDTAEKELKAVKANLGKKDPKQSERYRVLKENLSQLIY